MRSAALCGVLVLGVAGAAQAGPCGSGENTLICRDGVSGYCFQCDGSGGGLYAGVPPCVTSSNCSTPAFKCVAGQKQTCSFLKGICAEGERTCEMRFRGIVPSGSEWGECSIPPRNESTLCDGIDDDCDGVTDEPPACTGSSVGECRPGTPVCKDGHPACEGAVTPRAEECNNRDDDCDGETDEGCLGPRLRG